MPGPTRLTAAPPVVETIVHPNPFVRTKGQHQTASAALEQGLRRGLSQKLGDLRGEEPTEDYAQIDPTLDVARPSSGGKPAPPEHGVGYAGMTPSQRRWFVAWLGHPDQAAPPAFRSLYVAYLEIALVETEEGGAKARQEIARLLSVPAWRTHTGLMRAWLLGAWLAGDGLSLTAWPEGVQPGEELLLIGLGLQAQLGVPLPPQQALAVMDALALGAPDAGSAPDVEIMKHRLGSLAASLGAELLAHCLAQMPPEEMAPRPWRCSHRDLRLALPQPNLSPLLRPLLLELAAQGYSADSLTAPSVPDEAASPNNSKWTLTLEFQESRSQYFDYALAQAKKQPTFSQIMDENRRLVYRLTYAKSQLRSFWRIWEYVNKWTGTKVYVNGKEVESWKLWPQSPYLSSQSSATKGTSNGRVTSL